MTSFSCCYDCKKRTLYCHDTCPLYLSHKKEHDEAQEKIKRQKNIERDFQNYLQEMIEKERHL